MAAENKEDVRSTAREGIAVERAHHPRRARERQRGGELRCAGSRGEERETITGRRDQIGIIRGDVEERGAERKALHRLVTALAENRVGECDGENEGYRRRAPEH